LIASSFVTIGFSLLDMRVITAEENLRSRRKGDRQKVQIAARLRRETVMTLKWIANRLHMVGLMSSTALDTHRKNSAMNKCK
jgi:hypothetical protein